MDWSSVMFQSIECHKLNLIYMLIAAVWQMVIFFHALFKSCTHGLLHWRDGPTTFLAQLLMFTIGYIYIYICVLISIFVFCYGTEKCHIHIVWYVTQSCELVITTSHMCTSRLQRCHGHGELSTTIILGWTLCRYLDTFSLTGHSNQPLSNFS